MDWDLIEFPIHIRKEKTYDVLSLQRENGIRTKILGKSNVSKETNRMKKQKRKKHTDKQLLGNCVCLSGRMHMMDPDFLLLDTVYITNII